MIFSRAIAYACLTFLAGALVLVAALLIVLVIVQAARGDAGAQPVAHLVAALAACGVALACRALARRIA